MVEHNKDVYSVSLSGGSGGFVDRIVTRKRAEMFDLVMKCTPIDPADVKTVLDVGSTKDRDSASSNYFARRFAAFADVTLVSDQPIDPANDIDFPVSDCLVGDAKKLETNGTKYDLVFSSATIEHVGNDAGQRAMIDGCLDAAGKYLVLTTPNRWHPVEFHTSLPFLHWLPRPLHRKIVKLLGFDFFAEESNLNLLDRRDLERLIKSFAEDNRIQRFQVETIRFLGFVSNLILIIHISNHEASGSPA